MDVVYYISGGSKLIGKCHLYYPSKENPCLEIPEANLRIQFVKEFPHESMARLLVREFVLRPVSKWC